MAATSSPDHQTATVRRVTGRAAAEDHNILGAGLPVLHPPHHRPRTPYGATSHFAHRSGYTVIRSQRCDFIGSCQMTQPKTADWANQPC